MIVIRKDQMHAFQQVALQRFEDDLLEHLHTYFPKHWEIVGPESLRHVIQLGVSRAESYGLTAQREIYLYVSLMLYLGSFFDTDVQLPWARKILEDSSIEYSFERIERLYDKAMAFLEQVAGPNGEHYASALDKAKRGSAGFLEQRGATSSDAKMITLMDWIYPQKCQAVGEVNLRRFIERGIDTATNYGLSTQTGIAVYIVLMFLAGEGFDKDPKFPWAEMILNDTSMSGDNKIEHLYAAAMSCLNNWLILNEKH